MTICFLSFAFSYPLFAFFISSLQKKKLVKITG